MSREPARNLAASVRARLLTLAQEKGEDYQRILGKYTVERFLFQARALGIPGRVCSQRRDAIHAACQYNT